MIKVAMLWLVNEDGELLLARRADHKAQDPGLWGPSVTGKLEPDEDADQALVREAQEELGLSESIYKPELLFETDFAHPDGEMRHFSIYTARIPKDTIGDMVIDQNEVAEVAWMRLSKIRQMLSSKPGEIVPASAFVLWERIFTKLKK